MDNYYFSQFQLDLLKGVDRVDVHQTGGADDKSVQTLNTNGIFTQTGIFPNGNFFEFSNNVILIWKFDKKSGKYIDKPLKTININASGILVVSNDLFIVMANFNMIKVFEMGKQSGIFKEVQNFSSGFPANELIFDKIFPNKNLLMYNQYDEFKIFEFNQTIQRYVEEPVVIQRMEVDTIYNILTNDRFVSVNDEKTDVNFWKKNNNEFSKTQTITFDKYNIGHIKSKYNKVVISFIPIRGYIYIRIFELNNDEYIQTHQIKLKSQWISSFNILPNDKIIVGVHGKGGKKILIYELSNDEYKLRYLIKSEFYEYINVISNTNIFISSDKEKKQLKVWNLDKLLLDDFLEKNKEDFDFLIKLVDGCNCTDDDVTMELEKRCDDYTVQLMKLHMNTLDDNVLKDIDELLMLLENTCMNPEKSVLKLKTKRFMER